MGNIYEKIQSIRVELHKLNLTKSGVNKFANFKYYQLEDFIPSLNNLLLANKLFTNFSISNNVAYLTITNAEKTDEVVVFESPIASADIKGSTPIQCLGGIHTYMKRYLYQNAFEISEGDMLDSMVGTGKIEDTPRKPTNTPVNPQPNSIELANAEQINAIRTMGENVVNWCLKKFKINSIEEISNVNANIVINMYKNKRGEQ